MRAIPSDPLRRGEALVREHGQGLPVDVIVGGLRVATQLRASASTVESLPIGASRLGGQPDVPAGFVWPRWEGFEGTDEHDGNRPLPLSFLAQISLREFPDATGLLPETGWLLFFYDAAQQPWGFDPRDRGCARVIWVDTPIKALVRTEGPHDSLEFESTLAVPELTATLPRWNVHLGLDLEDDASDRYSKLSEELVAGPEPHHRVLGWPKVVQNEMELQCQLVSNGLYCGDSSGYASPEAKKLEEGVSDWILLLQLDTDEEGPGWMWGDAGCIYFWIRRQDLAARNFDAVWVILQCG